MKKLFKKLVAVAAALAIVAVSAAGITAQAAVVTDYTWESTSDGGVTWSTVPASMEAAVGSLDYDDAADTFTITSAGTVFIYGVPGYISEVYATDTTGAIVGDELLAGGSTAVITNVTGEPVYVYYKITLLGGLFHREVSTRYTGLVY